MRPRICDKPVKMQITIDQTAMVPSTGSSSEAPSSRPCTARALRRQRRRLDRHVSAVRRAVALLEGGFGVRLLQRTTPRVTLSGAQAEAPLATGDASVAVEAQKTSEGLSEPSPGLADA
jgi:hypothetical protein